MSLVRWNPLKELNNLRRQMDSIFEEMTHRQHLFGQGDNDSWLGFNLLSDRNDLSWNPAIDLKETEQTLILKVELPGMEAKDIDVRVSDDRVSISGERKEEKQHSEKGCFYTELSYGQFKRVLPLPVAIDKDKIEASFKNGLLTLSLPKNKSTIENTVKVNLVEDKAREAMIGERLDRERQEETMHARAAEEVSSNN